MHLQNIVMRGEMSGIMALLEGCGAVLGIEDRWWRWDMGGVESYWFLVSIVWCVYHSHPLEYLLYYSIFIITLLGSYRLLINFTGMWNLVTRYVSFLSMSSSAAHCISSVDIDKGDRFRLEHTPVLHSRPAFLVKLQFASCSFPVLSCHNFPLFSFPWSPFISSFLFPFLPCLYQICYGRWADGFPHLWTP